VIWTLGYLVLAGLVLVVVFSHDPAKAARRIQRIDSGLPLWLTPEDRAWVRKHLAMCDQR
jgi:hypothetical protein